ncbi:type II toxin-antitoxin system PemK/MazF family toxin [Deinococcus sp. A31D244]|uniref:type II toxin-antitoxin system PemK/MazF family toxin n=1 Tax=Deinococcus sp. A31D244 TaxID=3397675 RepID=UPI0039E189FB
MTLPSGPTNTDFDNWCQQKKQLHASAPTLVFKEGEVWWCSVGANVGSEALGKGPKFTRPVIVLKKLSQEACIVVPVTSQQPKQLGTWYHGMHFNGRDQFVMMHQLRMVSVRRFGSRLVELPEADFSSLKQAIKGLLTL